METSKQYNYKKKVLYLGGFELPDKNAAAQRVINVSKILIELGYEVLFFGVSKNNTDYREKKEIENIKSDYYEKPYPRNKIQWLEQIISIKKEIEVIKKTPGLDMVICYNYPAIALYRLKKYCNKNNIKIVGDVTEWYLPSNKNIIFDFIKNTDTDLRMKFINKKLDGLICISKYLQNYYKDQNTVYIPGLVDEKDEKWNLDFDYKKNEIPTFIFVGDPGKKCEKERVDLLIKAVCEINIEKIPCCLKLVGIEKNIFEENYKELAQMKFYNENIIFMGKIPHKEAIKELKKADFSVIPRESKINNIAGFPTKLGESFCVGTPVIATNVGDMQTYIFNEKNGLIMNELDCEKLKITLQKMISDKNINLESMHNWTKNNNKLDCRQYIEKMDCFLNRI